jgi:hypothetical protein
MLWWRWQKNRKMEGGIRMANSDVETGRLCALVWEMKNIL